MQRLGFLTFRIQLLTGPLEVVDDGENLREGRADQLLTHVVLVAALALAEVVEIRRNAHVLAVERLVLLLQRAQLLLELLHPIGRIHRCRSLFRRHLGRIRSGLRRGWNSTGLNGLVLLWGGGVAAHADRSGIAV